MNEMKVLKEVVVGKIQSAVQGCKVRNMLGIALIVGAFIGVLSVSPMKVWATEDVSVSDTTTLSEGSTFQVEDDNGCITYEILSINSEKNTGTVKVTVMEGYENSNGKREMTVPATVQYVELDFSQDPEAETIYTFTVASINTLNEDGCAVTNLTSLTIEEGITSIGGSAFFDCADLISITLPESIMSIGMQAFNKCSSLTSITIPSSVTFIGSNTFMNCTNLQTVTINATGTVDLEETIFQNCNNLQTITAYSKSVYDELLKAKEEAVSSLNADSKVPSGIYIGISSTTIQNLQIVYISSEVDYTIPDTTVDTTTDTTVDTTTDTTTDTNITMDTMYEGESTTEEVWKPWEPTDPGDVYRHSLFGPEKANCEIISSTENITMINEIQGQLFFDALESVQGEYTIARTYNILVNNQLCYDANSAIIELEIPESLQEEDRTYSMFNVTEGGLANSLPDLDQELTTITFATNNQYYAFALGYMDDTTLSGTISEPGALVVGDEDDATSSGVTAEGVSVVRDAVSSGGSSIFTD